MRLRAWLDGWFLRWRRTYRLEYAGEVTPMVRRWRDDLYDVTAACDGLPNGGKVHIRHGEVVVAVVHNSTPGPLWVRALWASDDPSQFHADVYALVRT